MSILQLKEKIKKGSVLVAKSKERSEVEHLRATVKNQRSQIKNLKKELDRLIKRTHQYHDYEERISEQMIEEGFKKDEELPSLKENCPRCNEKVEKVLMGSRIGIFCECGYRKTKKS